HGPENMTVMRRLALNILRQAEKPENKKQDSLSKRMIWFRENRQFRQTVLRLLKNFILSVILSERVFTCVCPEKASSLSGSLSFNLV
ncbi:MAG: hypothetical protein MR856_02695, partial [Spirochaetia bacterium]|nr:hypothetical protein [Spirochaetia bacterium]